MGAVPRAPRAQVSAPRSFFIRTAGHEVVGGDLDRLGIRQGAGLGAVVAPLGEPAPGLHVDRVAHLAPEDHEVLVPGREVGDRDGAQERLRVGVLGVGEQLVRGRQLHALPEVHHHDLVGDVLHHAHVVGDEHVGQAQFLLQVHEQVQDLGLDGHVQGGDRLVADDELGVEGEGPGDADALAAPAVQLVGVGVGVAPGQAHEVHERAGPVVGLRSGLVLAVDEHVLRDDSR